MGERRRKKGWMKEGNGEGRGGEGSEGKRRKKGRQGERGKWKGIQERSKRERKQLRRKGV